MSQLEEIRQELGSQCASSRTDSMHSRAPTPPFLDVQLGGGLVEWLAEARDREDDRQGFLTLHPKLRGAVT